MNGSKRIKEFDVIRLGRNEPKTEVILTDDYKEWLAEGAAKEAAERAIVERRKRRKRIFRWSVFTVFVAVIFIWGWETFWWVLIAYFALWMVYYFCKLCVFLALLFFWKWLK